LQAVNQDRVISAYFRNSEADLYEEIVRRVGPERGALTAYARQALVAFTRGECEAELRVPSESHKERERGSPSAPTPAA
jgi:hypothetical protein